MDNISEPEWLNDVKERARGENNVRFRMPYWAVAAVSVLATVIFMLTPPGRAVSEFIYDVDVRWNNEESKFEINYSSRPTGDVPDYIFEKEGTSEEFTDIGELLATYPDLPVLVNDDIPIKNITVISNAGWFGIITVFDADGAVLELTQTIYSGEFDRGRIEAAAAETPVKTAFNNGTIEAEGMYNDGHGNVTGYTENCEFVFCCHGLPYDEFLNFIENCHIRK